MHYSSGPWVIPHPLPEVNFLMVEIPTPNPYIFMIRVNRQMKCPKSWGPRSSPYPTGCFFENYTYLWNHFVNFNQTLPKCSVGDPPKLCSVCHTRGILDRPYTCMVADTFLIVLIVWCFKKTSVVSLLSFIWFVTVSPLSSKTNICYNITSVILIIYVLSSETWWYLK